MLNLLRSILFGFVLLGTGLAAQGVDLQRLLQNDPDENAGAIIPHRSGWIFWLAGVKLHQC